jgi:hypothetical protein
MGVAMNIRTKDFLNATPAPQATIAFFLAQERQRKRAEALDTARHALFAPQITRAQLQDAITALRRWGAAIDLMRAEFLLAALRRMQSAEATGLRAAQ